MNLITHYTKIKTLLNHILKDTRFLMNLIERTNDPFEYKKRYTVAIEREESNKDKSKIIKICTEILTSKITVGCFVTEFGNQDDFLKHGIL